MGAMRHNGFVSEFLGLSEISFYFFGHTNTLVRNSSVVVGSGCLRFQADGLVNICYFCDFFSGPKTKSISNCSDNIPRIPSFKYALRAALLS